MTLAPYLTAAPHIQFHIAVALISLILGPFALYTKKRNRLHKTFGYIWVVTMTGVALSSFMITSFGVIGPFSPIHLLAIFTLWSLYTGIRHVVQGRINAHRVTMRNLYWYGLIIAGLFNFLPGRSTNRIFFEGQESFGYYVLGAGILILVANTVLQKRRMQNQSIFSLEKPAAMV